MTRTTLQVNFCYIQRHFSNILGHTLIAFHVILVPLAKLPICTSVQCGISSDGYLIFEHFLFWLLCLIFWRFLMQNSRENGLKFANYSLKRRVNNFLLGLSYFWSLFEILKNFFKNSIVVVSWELSWTLKVSWNKKKKRKKRWRNQ